MASAHHGSLRWRKSENGIIRVEVKPQPSVDIAFPPQNDVEAFEQPALKEGGSVGFSEVGDYSKRSRALARCGLSWVAPVPKDPIARHRRCSCIDSSSPSNLASPAIRKPMKNTGGPSRAILFSEDRVISCAASSQTICLIS